MKKTIVLLDWSPVVYGAVFSGTNYAKENKLSHNTINDIKKYDFNEYKDIVIHKIFDELSMYKTKFNADEVVICADNSEGGYWRKDIWEGYKSKRSKQRDESPIQWDKAYETITEINDIIKNCTKFKFIEVPRAEGDDIIFVLGEYLSLQDNDVIVVSSDHDFLQLLKHDNIKFWRTTRTQGMENSHFEIHDDEKIQEIINEHCLQGDIGDGFGNIKHYSRFSKDFLEMYPQYEGKELQLYPKRFLIETKFYEKTQKEAYNHPRYGYKMFLKSKKTLDELLNENEIYKMNYEMNSKLALPEHIPSWLSEKIIESYKISKSKKDPNCLMDFFRKYQLRDLIDRIIQL